MDKKLVFLEGQMLLGLWIVSRCTGIDRHGERVGKNGMYHYSGNVRNALAKEG
jgi:hypothetical protein